MDDNNWDKKLYAEMRKQQQRIKELEQLAVQRGARMQIMRDWMVTTKMPSWIGDAWNVFLDDHPEAKDWFDAMDYHNPPTNPTCLEVNHESDCSITRSRSDGGLHNYHERATR